MLWQHAHTKREREEAPVDGGDGPRLEEATERCEAAGGQLLDGLGVLGEEGALLALDALHRAPAQHPRPALVELRLHQGWHRHLRVCKARSDGVGARGSEVRGVG